MPHSPFPKPFRWLTTRPAVLLWIVLLAAAGCGGGETPDDDGGQTADSPLRVAVSVPPQAWLVEAVGGDRVEVVSLVGPGDSPETYQPTDAEVSRVLASRLYFRGGVPFERGAWFEALASAPGLTVVDLRQGLDRGPDALPADPGHRHGSPGEGDGETAGGTDPHLWLSPRRLFVQAGTVADALVAADPDNAEEYSENFHDVLARLQVLDRELELRLAPHAGRSFYVFHPAWSYLAADYGLQQVAIEIDGKSPSDAELTRLQESARRDGTRVVFVQPQIPHRAAEAVAEAVGAEVAVLDPLERDVPANLRRAAEAIAASYRETSP